MGGVFSIGQEPDGASTKAVEPRSTATRSYSYSLSTNNPPVRAHQTRASRSHLSWRPIHKFGQEKGSYLCPQNICQKEPAISLLLCYVHQQRISNPLPPEPEIEMPMTSPNVGRSRVPESLEGISKWGAQNSAGKKFLLCPPNYSKLVPLQSGGHNRSLEGHKYIFVQPYR